MPNFRCASMTDLEYIARNLVESHLSGIEWSDYAKAIRFFTKDDADARVVLGLIENCTITVSFEQIDPDVDISDFDSDDNLDVAPDA